MIGRLRYWPGKDLSDLSVDIPTGPGQHSVSDVDEHQQNSHILGATFFSLSQMLSGKISKSIAMALM